MSNPMDGHRVALYYQTQYDRSLPSNSQFGHYVSPLPLLTFVTHIILAAFHINANRVNSIALNDNNPDDEFFAQMWVDLKEMQGNGVKVIGMLGGAAPGSYPALEGDGWDIYYPQLKHYIEKYNINGMDLDVEEFTSLELITKLINTLKADFGPDFIITLAPVASALLEEGNLSGFDYIQLEKTVGFENVSWYNAQFYSGFGSFFPDDEYIQIVEFGEDSSSSGSSTNPPKFGLDPSKLVATSLTSPDSGFGFIDPNEVVSSALNLSARYGYRFGGVAGWEYFNSEPGYSSPDPGHVMPGQGDGPGGLVPQPWVWAEMMAQAMKEIKAKAKAALQANVTVSVREAAKAKGSETERRSSRIWGSRSRSQVVRGSLDELD